MNVGSSWSKANKKWWFFMQCLSCETPCHGVLGMLKINMDSKGSKPKSRKKPTDGLTKQLWSESL